MILPLIFTSLASVFAPSTLAIVCSLYPNHYRPRTHLLVASLPLPSSIIIKTSLRPYLRPAIHNVDLDRGEESNHDWAPLPSFHGHALDTALCLLPKLLFSFDRAIKKSESDKRNK